MQFAVNKLIDLGEENFAVIAREGELFFGVALTIAGLMGFSSSRFCDGNTADYLSCTRPTSYHYYGYFAIALAIIGAFFIILWFLKRRAEEK